MLIDTHLHLDAAEFDATRGQVIAEARAAGVKAMMLMGVLPANFDAITRLADENPDCHLAYGIHPLFVRGLGDAALAEVESRLKQGRAIAVGEIGLDHYVEDTDREHQQRMYVAQLKLARERDLPVLLHVRRAQDAVLKELRRLKVPGGIAHAFNGSRQQADAFIKLGFKLGFGGAMTYSGSRRIRELAATLPLESIVLETDGPDIPPGWRPEGPSLPAELPRYAQVLAELRGEPVEQIIEVTGRNAVAAIPGLAPYLES